MTYDGSRIPWTEGKKRLDAILDWGEQDWFDRWQLRLAQLDGLPDGPLRNIAVAGLTNTLTESMA